MKVVSIIATLTLHWDNDDNDLHTFNHADTDFSSDQSLTHLPLDKMDAISQMIFSDEFLWIKHFFLIKISLKIVP